MGSRLFKASGRVTCRILVMWMGLITLGPILHDGVGHDDDWAPVLVQHDASHHRIADASFPPLGEDEHCVVCHLFCGSRYTATPSAAVHVAFHPSFAVLFDRHGGVGAATAEPLPARAPPACS